MTGPHHVQRKAKLRRRVRLREWLSAGPKSILTVGDPHVASSYTRIGPWAEAEIPLMEGAVFVDRGPHDGILMTDGGLKWPWEFGMRWRPSGSSP